MTIPTGGPDLYPTEEQSIALAESIADEFHETCGENHKRAAFWILYACKMSEMMHQSIRRVTENEPTVEKQRRQLVRLTRDNPRKGAINGLSGQAKFWLERALIELGQWTKDWQERQPRELSEAAKLAMTLVPVGGPKPEDHAGEMLIASIANIAEQCLGMNLSASRRSRFRKLLCVCATYCPCHLSKEEFRPSNPGSARRTSRAIRRLREGTLRFGPHVLFGKLKQS